MYKDNVLALGPIAYWTLSEASGSVAPCEVDSGQNGVHYGVTLGEPGIGDGETCAYYGTYDSGYYTDIYSAAFDAAFNGDEGSISLWAKVANVGIWTDGTQTLMIDIASLVTGSVTIQKWSVANQLAAGYTGKAVIKSGMTTVDWFHVVITWSATADEVKVYYNGAQEGATKTGLTAWSGNLDSGAVRIGAFYSANHTFEGWLAHVAVWDRALTPTEVTEVYTISAPEVPTTTGETATSGLPGIVPRNREETQYQVLVRDWDGAYVGVVDTWRSLSYLKVSSDMGNLDLRLGARSPYLDFFDLDYIMEVWRKPWGVPWYCDFRAFWRGQKRIVDGLGDESYIALGLGLNHLLARRIAIRRGRYGVYYPGDTVEDFPDRVLWKMFVENFSADAIEIWEPDYFWWEGDRQMPRITMQEPGGTGEEIAVQYLWRNVFEIAQECASAGGDFRVEMVGNDFELKWYPDGEGLDRTMDNTDGNEPCVFSMYLGNMREPVYQNDRTSEATCAYVTSESASGKLRVGYSPKVKPDGTLEHPEDYQDYRMEDSPWNRIEGHRDGSGIPGWKHTREARRLVRELRPIEAFTFFPIESPGCKYGVHFGLGDHVTTYWGPTFTKRIDKHLVAVKVYVDHNGEEVVVEAGDVT